MPAGMPWPQYITFFVVAMLTSLAGSQAVHLYYKPLDDLEELVQQEIERRRKAREQVASSI